MWLMMIMFMTPNIENNLKNMKYSVSICIAVRSRERRRDSIHFTLDILIYSYSLCSIMR